MKWKVICSSEPSQLCARNSPLRRWRRLSRFGAPHQWLRWRELVLGMPPAPATVWAPSHGVGELRDSLEDHVPLGHAGRPESGLHEQSPRAAAPFLSVDFPRLGWRRHEGSAPAEFRAWILRSGWRRHEGSAPAEFRAWILRSGRESMEFEMRRGRDKSDFGCFARRQVDSSLLSQSRAQERQREVVALLCELCDNSTSVARRSFQLILSAQRNQRRPACLCRRACPASRRTLPRRCSHTVHRGLAAASWLARIAHSEREIRRNWEPVPSAQ